MNSMSSIAIGRLHVFPSALNGSAPTPATTLDDVRDLVDEDDTEKWDTLVPRAELSLRNGKLALPVPSGEALPLTLTPWATGQLCSRLGIPASYFRRCPVHLQDEQANFWLRQPLTLPTKRPQRSHDAGEGDFRSRASGNGHGVAASTASFSGNELDTESLALPWRLRAKQNRVRAILSGRYSPLDNCTLLETLMPLFQRHHRVDWCGLSPESLHLRIIDPLQTRDILPGDGLSIGVHIANSEVGFRAVTVDALIFRLVCSNGLIRLVKGKSLLRQRHIHLQQPRFISALENAVAEAFVTADEFLEQLRRSARVPVSDVESTIERIGEKWNLSESTTDSAKAMLLREPVAIQETLYGIVNAFTSAAQRLPDEGRYDLEVLAGRLAEHGVAAYAPRAENGRTRESAVLGDPASAIVRAKELFRAEVVVAGPRA